VTVRIDIGICTFQRPQIVDTLRSLAAIKVPKNAELRIIVADNDDAPSAESVVAAEKLPFPLIYIHAPSRNISIARNAVLDNATAPYLAFIDDDETVDPNWLNGLYDEAIARQADVVFGPVFAEYPPETPEWIVAGDYHSVTEPATVSQVHTGPSGNALIHLASSACSGQRFDLTLGKSGGEDTVFFSEIAAHGGKLFFAHDAHVFEKAAEQRLSADWLIKRRYRYGQSYATAKIRSSITPFATRVTLVVKATLKAAVCYGAVALNTFNNCRRQRWRIRGALHRGVVSKCFGSKEDTLYGVSS